MSGFTREMIYSVATQLADSTTAESRVQPVTGSGSYSTTGSSIGFRIERQPQTFLDNHTLLLNGRVTMANAGTANTNVSILLGYAMSFFSTIRVKSNGTTADEIALPSQLTAKIYDMVLTRSDKVALSTPLLFDPIGTSQGCIFNTSNPASATASTFTNGFSQNLSFSFSIPIPCSITNASSMYPLFCADLEFEFILNAPSNIFRNILGGAQSPTYTLSQMEMVYSSIKLESEPFARLMAQQPLQDGYLVMKTDSWSYQGASTLAASSSAGRQDINFPAQFKSLKRLCFTSSPANAIEGTFAGVNPNLVDFQLIVGSDAYPRLPVRCNNPAEVFMNNQKALGAVYSSSHTGCIHPLSFARASTGGDLYDSYIDTTSGNEAFLGQPLDQATALNAVPTRDATMMCNKWCLLLDLESVAGNKELLYNGISTRGQTSYLRLNLERQLANSAHQLHVWSNYDMVYRFDPINFQTIVDV